MKPNATYIESLEPRQLLAAYPISVGSSFYDSAFKVTKLANDGVLVAGEFKGTIDLDPSSGQALFTAMGDTDIYVARYSEAGGLVWAHQFGGSACGYTRQFSRQADDPSAPTPHTVSVWPVRTPFAGNGQGIRGRGSCCAAREGCAAGGDVRGRRCRLPAKAPGRARWHRENSWRFSVG